MTKSHYTPEELVQTLKRSNTPTIVCEGGDDVVALRQIPNRLGVTSITILPCGGRETLLNVYRRRSEFDNNIVLFFADKDMWYFSGTPSEFNGVIFTWGYSIENDIFTFSDLENLLTPEEKDKFYEGVRLLSIWFACERRNFLSGNNYHCNVHARQILGSTLRRFDTDFKNNYQQILEPSYESHQILSDFSLELRGKTIFQLLTAILSGAGRRSKYSKDNIFEVALTFYKIPALETLRETAKNKFGL